MSIIRSNEYFLITSLYFVTKFVFNKCIDSSDNLVGNFRFLLASASEIISKITPNYIQNFLPKGKFVAYLGREGTYTETGFLVFDMRHNYASEYFERFKSYRI